MFSTSRAVPLRRALKAGRRVVDTPCAVKPWKLLLWMAVVVSTVGSTLAVASAAPPWRRVALHTKAEAERNVLRAMPHHLSHKRMNWLLDKRTQLVRNNVQVVCRGRGVHLEARYQRFVCTVRPHPAGQGLRVSYHALTSDRFRLHWRVLHKR